MKTFLLKNLFTGKGKSSRALAGFGMMMVLLISSISYGQNVSATWGTNASTAWYTGGNWTGGSYSGVQGTATSNTNVATFTSGATGNPIGINCGTANLNLGAVSVDNTRTTALNITNSSGTAGVLRLYGATVNSVANTVVRHNGTGLLTLQTTNTLGIVLSNTTENIFQVDNTGGITVAGIISELAAGNKLTKGGTGTGVMTLTAANTYTGMTTVSGGTLELNRSGGGTIPSGNSVTVSNGATLRIRTAQTLNNITVDAGGTLIVDATVTVSGTATINGTFQINQGGYATGTFTWGATGSSLTYNNTATYGPISGHSYWPTGSSNQPFNVNFTGTAGVDMGSTAHTIAGKVTVANAITNTGSLTINGTLQLNGGNLGNSPTYGASSTLIYNVTYGTFNEWTGGASTTVAAGVGIPANVVVQAGTLTLGSGSGGRGVPGNVTVNTGTTLILNATSGNDLYLGGNFAMNGTLTNNTRAVFFVKGSAQSITSSLSSVTLDYMIVNKTGSTSVTLGVPVIVNNSLTLTAGFVDLSTFNMTVGSTASASSTSYVKTSSTGQLKQVVTSAAKLFPVGTSAYNPITLNNSGTSDTYGIIEIDGTLPNANDATLTIDRRWVVTEAVSGGGNLSVVAQYNTGELGTNFASGTTPYLGIYTGTWTSVAATLAGSNPFTATSGANFTNSITGSSSYFAIGKDTGLVGGIVPPVFTSFSASPNDGTSTNGYVGSTVTITGSGFTGVTILKYNGSSGTSIPTFTVVNNTTITFDAPAGTFGNLYVENTAGNATSSSSFTNLGYITATTGTWQTPGTWLGGAVPPSASTTNITIAHNVTGTTGTTAVGKLTVNSGFTLTNTAAATINVNTASTNTGTITNNGTFGTAVTYTNSGTFTVGNGGTFQINQGGYYTGTAIAYNATASSLTFNNATGQYGVNNSHTYWPSANGPVTVNVSGAGGVQLQTGATRSIGNLNLTAAFDIQSASLLTVTGTTTINSGGSITSNPPVYGSSSTLVYNTTSNPYNVGTEWTGNATTAGAGIPNNVTVQNTNNVAMPTTVRGLAGSLTIVSGSTLTLNGTIGADLNVAGNWSNAGTFTPASRLVTFNGGTAQTLTGATTFDYLTLNNSNGLTLQPSSAVTVNQTLALTSGKITLGANNLTVASSGTITGGSATNYIVTNGAGQLKRTVPNSATLFPVGNAAYNPITFDNSGTSDVYGVVVADGAVTAALDVTKTVSRRWIVTEAVSGGSNLAVVAQYNTGEPNTNYNAGANPFIGFYNGTSWTQAAATLAGANPFTTTSGTNLSPANLTTGTQYFAAGKDNAFISVATTLVVTAISPTSPTAGSGFSVTVRSQDAYGLFSNVVANTAFSLTSNGNAGTIGGTLTGSITAGTSTVTVTGVTLPTAGTGVTVTATRTSGDVLSAGTSSTFTVLAAASQLVLVSVPSTGTVGVNLTSFTVEARRPDNSLDNTFTQSITLTKASGPGAISGTTSATAVAGVATFSAVQFTSNGTVTLTASSGSLTPATSGNIVISLVPASIFANTITGSNPNTSNPYTTGQTFNSNLTVSGIGRGAGITGNVGNDRYNATGWTTGGIDLTDYFEFTLTPAAGYEILFGSFVYSATRSGSGPTAASFRSSVDGYTANIGSPTAAASGVSLSLTGAAYQNIDAPITFRYYAYTATGGTYSIDDFIFNGNVVCIDPIAYTVTGTATTCAGTGVPIGLSDSQNGIDYQLKLNGSNVGSTVAGTGSAISFGNQTAAGTYTVVATNTHSPCSFTENMSGSAIVTYNTTTAWVGNTSTAWATASNWSCGVPFSGSNVTINSGGTFQPIISSDVSIASLTLNASLVVPSNYDLTVANAITNNSTLTIENNANLVQTHSGANANSGSGTVTVNRDSNALNRLDYTMWSSPVTGQNLLAFSPLTANTGPTNIRFYTYNWTLDRYDAVASAGTTDFAPATGYLIRMPNNSPDVPATPVVYPGVFTGEIHNGPISLSSLTNGLYYGTGNPYPSTIDADTFINVNSLTDALYFWRKINAASGSAYATYTLAGGASPSPGTGASPSSAIPNGTIQVGQGFIAKAASGALSFTNAMRTGNNVGQFFRNAQDRSRVWLNLTNTNGFFSQTMIAYMTGATTGVDAAIDGKYFNDSQTALTSVINGGEYAVQGRPVPFEVTDVVPLGFKSETAGNYTISINSVDGLFETANQTIYLKDNLLATTTNLSAGNYDFTTASGVFNNRFEIVYEAPLATIQPVFDASNVILYKQNHNIVINTGKSVMATVKVYDIRGRLLIEKNNINASEIRIETDNTDQVLIVKITSDNDVTVTKKVVN